MAQNITTLLQKDDAGELSGNDLLYIVQGTGSNRDRKLKLAALLSHLNAHGVAVDEIDAAPGYLAEKLAAYNGGSDAFSDGDVLFEVVDSRSGSHTKLKAHIAPKAVKSEHLDDELVFEVENTTYKLTINGNLVKLASGGGYVSIDSGSIVLVKETGQNETKTEITPDKVSTPNFFLTFDPKGRNSNNVEDYDGMQAFEQSVQDADAPTEYFAATHIVPMATGNRDYYYLNSAAHEKGAVVLIRNVDNTDPLKLYRESDTNHDYPLCEIPPRSTKAVVYHGPVATGTGTGVTHVWDVL